MSVSKSQWIRALLAMSLIALAVVIGQGISGISQSTPARPIKGAGPSVGASDNKGSPGPAPNLKVPHQDVGPGNSSGAQSGGMAAMSTRPLRDIPVRLDKPTGPIKVENDELGIMRLPDYLNKPDPVVQRKNPEGASPLIPNPLLNFAGMSIFTSGCNCAPPDTNGDVGPSHYVQTVNAAFQIFNKSGTSLYGPANINTLWSGVGDLCDTTNRGDPVVLYDPIGNRWLISQFAFNTDSGGNKIAPFYQCMAVSASPDPLGSYWLYDWNVNNSSFPDYPKFGVWPNAFYMTTNNFGPSGRVGPQVFAFERATMENGAYTRFQYYNPLGSSVFPLLPADLDGRNLPSDGTTDLIVGFWQPVPMWKFHVDFDNINNTYLSNFFNLPVAGFSQMCFTCVTQPGTTQMLDSLADRPLFRLAYRNHGGYESLVWTHDVDVGSQHGGLRWYEVNNPYGYGSNPFIYQQGTYAPDADNRWMGSIAEDNRGDIAAVYSVSSSSTFPSIRYAGRVLADPLGTFQGGLNFQPGASSQVSGNRWGDYASMSVDPNDDCTFWFTTEYNSGGDYAWYTRIGAFKFAECVSLATFTPTPTNTPTNTPTFTPTRTPTPVATTTCGPRSNYDMTVASSAIVPGTVDAGNQCDDCATNIALPFSYTLYDQTFTSVDATSNGQLDFGVTNATFTNTCLPDTVARYAIFPHWDDMRTDAQSGCSAYTSGCGIFTSVSGVAPNRIFNIEWRAVYFANVANAVNFEVRLYEGKARFDLIYGAVPDGGLSATVGVQDTGTPLLTQYSCNVSALYSGLDIIFVQVGCGDTCGTGANYAVSQTTGSIVPGTVDSGDHCDDCTVNVPLPFTYNLYDQAFSSANVDSNGTLQFASTYSSFSNYCLPYANISYAIFPHWDDLRTDAQSGCSAFTSGCGIFTSVSGVAPNRIFNIEWRAVYYASVTTSLNFEVRLYEGQARFDVIYGNVPSGGASATIGVQQDAGFLITQRGCNQSGLFNGEMLIFQQPACPTPTFTPTRTFTPTPTRTFTPTFTPTRTFTNTPTNTFTSTRTNTPLNTLTGTPTLTRTPTSVNTTTRTSTPTITLTPGNTIDGHLTWQGIAQPDSHNTGLTATLTLCVGGLPQSHVVTTDLNGHFTLVTVLPNGAYNWWLKRNYSLANSGSFTLAGGTNSIDFGTLRAGDCDTNNVVGAPDFNILKAQFGQAGTGFSADFNNDAVVNASDFNLLKGNFGNAGAAPNCP